MANDNFTIKSIILELNQHYCILQQTVNNINTFTNAFAHTELMRKLMELIVICCILQTLNGYVFPK